MSDPFAQYPYPQYPAPPPPRRHRHWLGLGATVAVAVAVGAGATLALQQGGSLAGSGTGGSKPVLTAAEIANRVDPSLVDVVSTLGYQGATAYGTGIVLTSNGEILTNNHVINGATSITVTDIGNGRTYKAAVVGYDEGQDIAVLQLSGASGLATAPAGNSSTVKAGDGVVALGNAGGKGGTPSVATGSVTALNQSITATDEGSGTSEQLTGMIESNADIQPGDSGGPLVNSHGQVVGVDTAASTDYQFSGGGFGGNGGSAGSGSGDSGTQAETHGFTIPINTALSVAGQIEAGDGSGSVHIGQTAFLGVSIATGQGGQGGYGYGYGTGSGTSGVQIAGVSPGTPAAGAGLAAGDVITSVAGHAVGSGTSIQQVLEGYHPGDKVTVAWADPYGQSHSATVILAAGPAA